MDLFVVQRYEADHEVTQEEEQSKLDQLFKKIEKNKLRKKNGEHTIKNETDIKPVLKQPLESEIKELEEPVPNLESLSNEKRQQLNDESVESGTNQIESDEDKKQPEGTNQIENNEDTKEPKRKRRKKKHDYPENVEGFTVLGADTNFKKEKARLVLPKWLMEPTVISTNLRNLQTKISSMKTIDKDLRRKLKANGVKYLFPVQAEVIPWLLESNNHSCVLFPRDICVSAPTGSGKTLAFVLPIIQALKKHLVKKIRALVLLPTQDLALQVFKTFKTYCDDTNVDVCFITGKNSFSAEQKSLISENESFGFLSRADIAVCTAGRLVDHIKHTPGFDLRHLEFLVIDEADRVLDNIQHDWLYHLENHLKEEDPGQPRAAKVLNLFSLQKKRPPQKLLFSATLSQDPEKLQKLSLFQPKLFTSIVEENENVADKQISETFVGKYTTPNELTEQYIVCSLDVKPLVLYKYIQMHNLTRTMVFTNSISDAHRLCILLRELFDNKLRIEEMSSHLDTNNRKQLIAEFSKGNISVIICTDALARGIDLPDVQCVISYSAPKHLKTYIHRAGRTARAGSLGTAVTLLHTTQIGHFQGLLKQAEKKNVEEVEVPTDDLKPLVKIYEKALNELKKTVVKEEEEDLNKIKRTKQQKPGKFKRKRTISNNSN